LLSCKEYAYEIDVWAGALCLRASCACAVVCVRAVVRAYVCVRACTVSCVCARARGHVCVFVRVHMRVRVRVCTCAYHVAPAL
jgi:hypothetical protein